MQPRVTIVTITYNLLEAGREKTFRQCVESVHNQTYSNIEYIIIDGASNDGSIELIKEYANKGWLKYYSEPDDGIYGAMNKGLQKSTGKYITYLNSDDFYHKRDGVARTVIALERSKSDFAYSSCLFLSAKDDYIGGQSPTPEAFCVRMPFSHQTLFVSTDLMKNLKGFNTNYRSAGDFDFITRMFLCGAKGIDTKQNFVSYRMMGLSFINREQSKRECLELLKENYQPLTEDAINYKEMFESCNVPYELYKSIQDKVNKDFEKMMKNKMNGLVILKDNKKYVNLQEYSRAKLKKSVSMKSVLLKIFSIKNSCQNGKKYKVITVLGIKIKFKKIKNSETKRKRSKG